MIYKRLIIFVCLLAGTFLSFAQSDSLAHESAVLSYADAGSPDTRPLADYRKNFWDSIPEPIGYVNDWEGLFTEDQVFLLDSIIGDFEKLTTAQIGIVTVDTFSVAKDRFDDLAHHIFATWGIGTKEKNNGVLIILSKGYKLVRIDHGLGIENLVSDKETQQLIDSYFIPEFRKENYFEGTLNGLQQEISLLSSRLK